MSCLVIRKALLCLFAAVVYAQTPPTCNVDSNNDAIIGARTNCRLSGVVRRLSVAGGANVTVTGRLTATSLSLSKNAALLAGSRTLEILVSGNASFELGSIVDGRLKGFADATAPGYPFVPNSGASHAGCVSSCAASVNGTKAATSSPPAIAYGNFAAPLAPGSTGYSSSGTSRCFHPGGAAFRLHVGGSLQLDAELHFGPGTFTGCGGATAVGGPSGGSIFITCSHLAPSVGKLSVSGGSGAYGGSAGRISVVCSSHSYRSNDEASYALTLQALGGTSSAASVYHGASGTVWLSLGTDAQGVVAAPSLLIDGRGIGKQPATIVSWLEPTLQLSAVRIVLTGGAHLQLVRDAAFGNAVWTNATVAAELIADVGSILEVTTNVALSMSSIDDPSSLQLRSLTLRRKAGGQLRLPQLVTVGASAQLEVYGSDSFTWPTPAAAKPLAVQDLRVLSGGRVSLLHGAELSCSSLFVAENGSFVITSAGTVSVRGNATFSPGSLVDGRGLGFKAASGPGAPKLGTSYGAAHAGCGSQGNCAFSLASASSATAQEAAYGAFTAPMTPGSGARSGGSDGGAAFRLRVNDTLELNGAVVMSGEDLAANSINNLCGAGAGGSIFVTCGRLGWSAGSLAVDGGSISGAFRTAYGGSAGRIAIVCDEHSYSSAELDDVALQFRAVGGRGSSSLPAGASGTVWLSLGTDITGAAFPPTLLIDGGGRNSQPVALLWGPTPSVLNLPGVRVILRGSGRLQLSQDSAARTRSLATLTSVYGDGTGTLQVGMNVSLQMYSLTAGQPLLLQNVTLLGLQHSEVVLQSDTTIGDGAVLEVQGRASPLWPSTPASLPLLASTITVLAGGTVAVTNGGVLSASALALQLGGVLSLTGGGAVTCSSFLMEAGSNCTVNMAGTINVLNDAVLEAGSFIDGRGTGYAAGLGPGSPGSGSGGAAHAGCGGQGGCNVNSDSAALSSTSLSTAYGALRARVRRRSERLRRRRWSSHSAASKRAAAVERRD